MIKHHNGPAFKQLPQFQCNLRIIFLFFTISGLAQLIPAHLMKVGFSHWGLLDETWLPTSREVQGENRKHLMVSSSNKFSRATKPGWKNVKLQCHWCTCTCMCTWLSCARNCTILEHHFSLKLNFVFFQGRYVTIINFFYGGGFCAFIWIGGRGQWIVLETG